MNKSDIFLVIFVITCFILLILCGVFAINKDIKINEEKNNKACQDIGYKESEGNYCITGNTGIKVIFHDDINERKAIIIEPSPNTREKKE